MDLSIVDIAPVRAGETAADAYEDMRALATRADELGYARYWVAEHHGLSTSAGSATPEVLIADLASRTERIRVGSGAVLLNHYSPFKVAETFSSLDALAPGRIDCGLGRATGMPAADHALSGDRPRQDHEEQIDAVTRHLDDAFPADHAYSRISIPRSPDGPPEVWVLGSSPSSAEIAGTLGLPYSFAAFIRPQLAVQAAETYREHFEPSEFDLGVEEPTVMLALNAVCAETDEEAARVRASAEAAYERMGRGEFGPPLTVEEAIDTLGGVPDPTPTDLEPSAWPRSVSGSPDTLADIIDSMAGAVGATEVMVQNLIEDPADRVRSHELLVDAIE